MKKILFILIVLFTVSAYPQDFYGVRTKTLTATDSAWTINNQYEFLQITVIDTGSTADTINVYYPITVGTTTSYAKMGKIMDLSTGENVTAMISSATALTKTYILWAPYPRAVTFIMGDTSTGTLFIKAEGKPN